MENEISNEYIENAINKLRKFFGVKEPVFSKDIFSLVQDGKLKYAIKSIANQLGLPIDINITYVPNYYTSQNSSNQFHSTHLAKVHKQGSGSEGIIAQVTIPESLPHYGSSALNGYPIDVKISNNCTEYPVVFAMIMSHELSHVLLYSLNHPKKENEYYTDLTAIMLGFQNIFKNGRSIIETEVEQDLMSTTTKTVTRTFGYLNDDQFNFAHNKINSMLEKIRESKKLLAVELKKIKKLLLKYKITLLKFNKFLEFLTVNINTKISAEDVKKMSIFFQSGYLNELDLTLKMHKEKQETTQKFLLELSHYTEQRINRLSIYIEEFKTYSIKIKTKLVLLKKDIIMLKKYISYKYRLTVFFVFLFKWSIK